MLKMYMTPRERTPDCIVKAPWDVLERISTKITNEIQEVSRVVYNVTHIPPATIEWE
ncbi:MAG: hypothetical protein JSV27_08560 [Candidatus Bathyarchaeota archaeon]|nr:MAG: hypothetical protein JSV27_08560 [Candidatus Bathyarchaeota archaeon]